VLNQVPEGNIMEKPKKRNRNGKGGAYRVPVGDLKYKENYNKIFRKGK
tara:strand:- start:1119 stop:1262 length:144 start_codon:yes stop_codon:yes gene_type:complete